MIRSYRIVCECGAISKLFAMDEDKQGMRTVEVEKIEQIGDRKGVMQKEMLIDDKGNSYEGMNWSTDPSGHYFLLSGIEKTLVHILPLPNIHGDRVCAWQSHIGIAKK